MHPSCEQVLVALFYAYFLPSLQVSTKIYVGECVAFVECVLFYVGESGGQGNSLQIFAAPEGILTDLGNAIADHSQLEGFTAEEGAFEYSFHSIRDIYFLRWI